MNSGEIPYRSVAVVCWVAALLCCMTVYFALKAVGFDLEAMSDPLNQLGANSEAAADIGRSMVCDAFGFYLLGIPAALFLWYSLRDENAFVASVATVSGLGYILVGALGAGVLSVVWPALANDYTGATSYEEKRQITALFVTITEAVYTGMWGRIEFFLAAVWWGGIGVLAWRRTRWFACWTLLTGVVTLVANVGELSGVKVLADSGLNLYLLMVPVWIAWVGWQAWREK